MPLHRNQHADTIVKRVPFRRNMHFLCPDVWSIGVLALFLQGFALFLQVGDMVVLGILAVGPGLF